MTASRLESWRRTGVLPRHRRRGVGRGRGSVVDTVDPVVVESAAALARHLRQGRDRRLAVLGWFAEAGMVRPGRLWCRSLRSGPCVRHWCGCWSGRCRSGWWSSHGALPGLGRRGRMPCMRSPAGSWSRTAPQRTRCSCARRSKPVRTCQRPKARTSGVWCTWSPRSVWGRRRSGRMRWPRRSPRSACSG